MSVPATGPRIAARAGLAEAGRRLSREPLTIGYFGASVTAQKAGYRPRLQERLRERFEQDHRSLFAGVGGVDVVAAVFLADDLVARHGPDICLIEFTSVELEPGRETAEAEAAMDGVIAKLTRAGTRPCLLHLTRLDWRPEQADMLAAFERVADRHRVPSIDLTGPFEELARISEGGTRIFRDEVHTTDAGAELLAEMIDAAIGSIAAGDGAGENGELMPDPPGADYRGAQVLPVSPEDAAEPAEMRLFRLHRPYLELPVGSVIRRRFAERLAGLVLVVDPEAGELEIADSTGRQRVMTWDGWCHFERFTARVFRRPCEPHEQVSIRLTDAVPDYASCRRPVEPPERRLAKVIGYMVLPA